MEPTLIDSKKGKKVLQYRNFIFHHHSNNKQETKSYWRCERRQVCNARLITNRNVENGINILKESGVHAHVANFAEKEVREVVQRIKRRAGDRPNEPPQSVVIEEMQGVRNEEVLSNLPQRMALVRMVNRRQVKNRPPMPRTLQELQILNPYDVTARDDRFLLYDSGRGDRDRVIVFCTDLGLLRLSQSDMLFVDGTFKTSPTMFVQIYTVHAIFMGHVFPFAYCLCRRKTKETYRIIFGTLKAEAADRNYQLQPTTVLLDFEIGAMNAAREIFPGVIIKGCLFHLNQSIWRRVIALGLKGQYNDPDDETVRNDVRRVMALAFVPEEDLREVFDWLKNRVDDAVDDVVAYMEKVYVRGVPARGRRRATPPLFPPTVWNVHNQVLADEARTTNVVEGWHSRFQRLINAHHPSVWKVLEYLKKEEQNNYTLMVQLQHGHVNIKYPINKTYAFNLRMVKTIVTNYEDYKNRDAMDTFLDAISYRLKLNLVDEYESEEEDDVDDDDDDD